MTFYKEPWFFVVCMFLFVFGLFSPAFYLIMESNQKQKQCVQLCKDNNYDSGDYEQSNYEDICSCFSWKNNVFKLSGE